MIPADGVFSYPENSRSPPNSGVHNRPFYHSDLRKNLEGVVIKNSDQKENTLERIFNSKTRALKATVKALLDEIELRQDLDGHLLNRIDEEICQQNTQLIPLTKIRTQYSFELSKEINKLKMQIEANLLELKKEKRKEYLECWRDLLFLKKYLMRALKDYWELVKRKEILKNDMVASFENG